jgi:hypothetical protein
MSAGGTSGTILVASDGVATWLSWWDMVRVQGNSVVLSGSAANTGQLVVLPLALCSPSRPSKELFIELDARIRAGARLFDARAWASDRPTMRM